MNQVKNTEMKKSLMIPAMVFNTFQLIVTKKIHCIILLLIVISISSCSDSPVSPGNPSGFEFIDTARFEWKHNVIWETGFFDMINIHMLNEDDWLVYEANGNIGRNTVYHIRENGYGVLDFEPDYPVVINTLPGKGTFLLSCVGTHPTKFKVWKWDGINFEFQKEIDLGAVSYGSVVSYGYIDHSGYLWFTSEKNKIFRFDGEELKMYDLYDNFPEIGVIGYTDLAYNGSGQLRVFGRKGYVSQPSIKELVWFIFRFENDKWVLEHEELITWEIDHKPFGFSAGADFTNYMKSGNDPKFIRYTKIGDQLIRYDNNILQVYNNAGGFNTYLNFHGVDIEIALEHNGCIGGTSLTDFLIPLYVHIPEKTGVYYFDGEKFSNELTYIGIWSYSFKIQFTNNKIYRVDSDPYQRLTIQTARRK